jgi:hypothetical protein
MPPFPKASGFVTFDIFDKAKRRQQLQHPTAHHQEFSHDTAGEESTIDATERDVVGGDELGQTVTEHVKGQLGISLPFFNALVIPRKSLVVPEIPSKPGLLVQHILDLIQGVTSSSKP